MLNVLALRNGTIPGSMTARELLAKASVVVHWITKRAIRHQQLQRGVPFTFRTALKVSKTIANLLQKAWLKNARDHMKL
jgi:hypothetical protein